MSVLGPNLPTYVPPMARLATIYTLDHPMCTLRGLCIPAACSWRVHQGWLSGIATRWASISHSNSIMLQKCCDMQCPANDTLDTGLLGSVINLKSLQDAWYKRGSERLLQTRCGIRRGEI